MSIAEQLRREGLKEGKKEGLEEGRKEEKIEAAKKMIQLDFDIEQIMTVTGLSEDTLNQIKDESNN